MQKKYDNTRWNLQNNNNNSSSDNNDSNDRGNFDKNHRNKYNINNSHPNKLNNQQTQESNILPLNTQPNINHLGQGRHFVIKSVDEDNIHKVFVFI